MHRTAAPDGWPDGRGYPLRSIAPPGARITRISWQSEAPQRRSQLARIGRALMRRAER